MRAASASALPIVSWAFRYASERMRSNSRVLLATNLRAGAVPFGAVTRRNPPALRNHAFVDSLLDLTDVVNALNPNIDDLDAQRGHVLPRPFDHECGQGITPQASF